MKKLLFFLFLFLPISVHALDYPSFSSKIIEVYDLHDEKVLYEVNSNNVTSIASLTKIATSITAIENISNLEEEVIITKEMLNTVSWEASVAGLRAGDHLTYKDLLYASMLPSGADATNSLAILLSGDIDSFVSKMNDLAVRLELKNTHFVNVSGLDIDDHYSTANDVRILLEYALKNDTFKKIFTTKEYTLSNGLIVKSTLYKYHADYATMEKIIGSKTGFTYGAGYCLASLSNINNHLFLILFLNADPYQNLSDTSLMIDFLREHYKELLIFSKDQFIQSIPIVLSKEEEYQVYSNKDILKYLPDDYDNNLLKVKYDGLYELDYHIHKGDKIGTVTYSYGDEILYVQDVVLEKEIHYDIMKIIQKNIVLIISVFLSIIVLFILFILFMKKSKKNKH